MKLIPPAIVAGRTPFVRFTSAATEAATTTESTCSAASCSDASTCSSCSCSSCSSSLVEPEVDPSAPHAFTTEDYLKEKPKNSRCMPRCYGACCATCSFMIFCVVGLASLLLYLYFNTSAMREGMTTY
jgi:hypothetical protein